MAYDYSYLKDAIQGWRREHTGKDPTNGLDDLMEVVKEVFHKDITAQENARFFKHVAMLPDSDSLKRVGESMGHSMGCAVTESKCSLCSGEEKEPTARNSEVKNENQST
jgi:hypothetical protein